MAQKNHHFVPQFVLRRFAVPGTRDKAVSVFNVDTGNHVPQASIRKQAAKGLLYGADGVVEKGFCELEARAATVTARLINGSSPPVDQSLDHVALIVFAALQHGRTPSAGKELEAAFTGLARGVFKFPGVVPPELREHIDNIRVIQPDRELFVSRQVLELAPVLDDLASVVVFNSSPVEFVCPDTGVVFHNQWGKPVRGVGVLGYACAGLQIFLPLSSRVLLCFYDPEIYQTRRGAKVVRLSREKETVCLNRLFCSCAEELVYFSGHSLTLQRLQSTLGSLERLTRVQSSKIGRFASETGRQQLVTHHTEQTQEPLQLSWLSVKRSMATFPINKRALKFRARAKEMADLARGPREAPDRNLVGHRFSRLPD